MFISSSIIIVFTIIVIVLLQYFIRSYIQKKDFKKRIEAITYVIKIFEKERTHHSKQMGYLFMAGESHVNEGFQMEKCDKKLQQLKQILANEKLIQSKKKIKIFS